MKKIARSSHSRGITDYQETHSISSLQFVIECSIIMENLDILKIPPTSSFQDHAEKKLKEMAKDLEIPDVKDFWGESKMTEVLVIQQRMNRFLSLMI